MVWKSDFYGTPEAFALLREVVDIYVADFKFGNDDCGERIAKVERYVATVTRNLADTAEHGDLIVRHLLLPGHYECCYRPIVERLAREMPGVKFSIRDGYLPRWQARHYGELAHRLHSTAAAEAHEYAAKWGLNVVC